MFLYGDWQSNAGPSNVTRSLIENSDEDLLYLKSKNKILKNVELIAKIYKSDIVVSSGIMPDKTQKKIKLMNKKMVYLMHGCIEYENKVNKLNLSEKKLSEESSTLLNANKIICVSEKYSKWAKEYMPEYSDKIIYLNNGVEIKPRKKKAKELYSIAVTGGNRNIKNNKIICRAAQKLCELGIPCKVYVFGKIYEGNENLSEYPCVEILGQLNKKSYYDKLDKISLLIMNSEAEPFGLVAADALNCNCSLLMSKNVGAQSIMNVNKCDIIENIHDIDCIIDKIQYIFDNNNSDRLLKTIDAKGVSCKSAYDKLKKLCNDIMSN